MSLIATTILELTPEEEAKIAALANTLATSKPRRIMDESRLTPDQILKIKRACIQGHSAKAICDAFKVSMAYVLKLKREYNPKKYQKTPLTLVEKAVLAKQMGEDGLTVQTMAELLGINVKTAQMLLNIPSPRYLVDQMLPYDDVLANLRSARYVANPVYKLGTNMRKVRLIVSSERQALRQVIIKAKK
ncbi:hypothetical protein [Cronobacter turicensis]|uniref:hypothetical protein n=1 Tax=Cronobacter turicensis TaxID=413502 RepID=UPI0024AF5B7E|nr:hypothetical protein [Cronobacter turicensis]MDI7419081.1 hypothetical protein [Cronobacter turicensis]MDI7497971.1 hypothetical protein [Cronobacter turicensis]